MIKVSISELEMEMMLLLSVMGYSMFTTTMLDLFDIRLAPMKLAMQI